MPAIPTPKKLISEHTHTFQLYLEFFVNHKGQYPLYLPNLPRGTAISLAMSLNRVNVQEAKRLEKESGIEASQYLTLSAKAKELDAIHGEVAEAVKTLGGQPGTWFLEISQNQRHTRSAKGPAWLGNLLEQARAANLTNPAGQPPAAAAISTDDDAAFLAALDKHKKV